MKTALVAILSLVFICTLYGHPYILLLALTALSAVFLLLHKKMAYLYVFAITAFFGPLAEAVAIYFGAWTYAIPQFIGIPVWLPVLWGLAGVFIVRVLNRVAPLLENSRQ